MEHLPDIFEKSFPGGICRLEKRQYSLRIHLHFEVLEPERPNSIDDLFPEKKDPVDIKLTISARTLDPKLKTLFPSLSDIHYYLANFVGNSEKV